MSSAPKSYSEIELAAADWLARQDGGMTSAQKTELARWLAADLRHAEAFDHLARAWSQLDLVQRNVKAESATAAVPQPTSTSIFQFPRAIITAMVASIAIAAAVWQFRPREDPPFATTAIAEAGAVRSVNLPDGSVVQLNTDSAVEVRYDSIGRHVRLVRGEAHFTVAHDEAKPFIVSVDQVAVRAVGTAFNVRLAAASVEVLVTEGKVRVDDAGRGHTLLRGINPPANENPVLAAGERVVVSLTPTQPTPAVVASVPAVEIKQALAWKEPRLEFDTVPLKTIVAEFNRHNHHQLVIADERLEILRFGGAFPANDYESLVRLLVDNYGVVATTQGERTIMRLAR